METEKHIKEEWKRELESSIYLSTKVKQEILEKVSSRQVEEKKQPKWMYPMVLSTFVIGAVFLLIITIQNDSLGVNITSNKSFTSHFNELLRTEKFYWMIGAILLETISILVFFEVLKKTKRWQSNALIRKVSKILATWTRNMVIQGFCCMVIGGAIVFTSFTILKSLTVFFVTLLNFLYLLWLVRNLDVATCPHCEQPFTRKELFKMNWAPYRLKCIHCKSNIYLSKDMRKNTILFTWVPLISIYGLGYLGIPKPILVFSFILVGAFFNFYIVKFTTRFSKEDAPLW